MSNLTQLINELNDEQIIGLVTSLGSENYIDTDNAIIFQTVCHHEHGSEGSMKLYYYKENKKFHCFTECGCNFNIIGLFERHYQTIGRNYDMFQDIILPIFGDNIYSNTQNDIFRYESEFEKDYKPKIQVNHKILNPNLLNIYTFYPTVEWLNDGITEETMRDYNIRYSIGENKIIIPHYDIEGNLIGIRARALNDEDLLTGKYKPVIIEGQLLNHQLGYNLYGLNLVKDNIKRTKMAIVAEGEKAALQSQTMFGKEQNLCVAACGSNFSFYQFQILQKLGVEKILIAFDKEGENWNKQNFYYEKLKKMCMRYSKQCTIGFIWDTHNLLNLKDSPFDKGKDTFLELYKGAVWL